MATYAWDFGNGVTFNGLTPPPQTYAAGIYNISLTITTNGGCQATATGVVKVGSIQPVPHFTCYSNITAALDNPFNLLISLPVEPINGSGILAMAVRDTAQNPIYSYTKPGTYDVSLTAYNNGCFQITDKNGLYHN